MTIINLVIVGFLAYVGYKLIYIVIDAFKLGFRQAEFLENEFGFDVLGAAKYQLGLQPSSKQPKEDDLC